MSNKNIIFCRGNTSVSVDFSASEIRSDDPMILLEKIEREHKLIQNFGKYLPDLRNPKLVTYRREAQLKQRVFMTMYPTYDTTHYSKMLFNQT